MSLAWCLILGFGLPAMQFNKCIAAAIVFSVPLVASQPMTFDACRMALSTALAENRNFPTTFCVHLISSSVDGLELSSSTHWTVDPCSGLAAFEGAQ